MEKTLEVSLKEQRVELINKIVKDFESRALAEIKSNIHSYNDCAVMAKMWLLAANEIENYK
jgi:hypothetical protein